MDNVWARFFPIFLEKDLLKVDKILGLTFFLARKDFEGFKTTFFHLLLLSFVVDGLFTSPVYSPRRGRLVNSAFPDMKNLAQKRSLFMTNKFESKCLQKFHISSKHEKECYMTHEPFFYWEKSSRSWDFTLVCFTKALHNSFIYR